MMVVGRDLVAWVADGEPTEGRPDWRTAVIADWCAWYWSGGWSVSRIAERLNISHAEVRRWLRLRGVDVEDRTSG